MSSLARDRGSASATPSVGGGAPLGLLSAANADLFRRFEAEEAKTNQLRAKEKQQSATLAALADRMEALNRELSEEEEVCTHRTEEIKQELDALDREEFLLDAQILARKRQVQAMSSALADIRIQLAYNFTVLPSSRGATVSAAELREGGGFTNEQRRASSVSSRRGSFRTPATSGSRAIGFGAGAQDGGGAGTAPPSVIPAALPLFNPVEFAESLTEGEMAEIVGESVFVDEAGVPHRVVFTDERSGGGGGGGTDCADDDTASSVNASPLRSQISRLKSDRARSSRASSVATASGIPSGLGSNTGVKSGISHVHWAQNTASKRASYVLLASAREEVAKQLREAEDRYQRGECVVDAEHTANVSVLQTKLEDLTNAMRTLLLTTPTAASLQQSPSLAQTGAALHSVASGAFAGASQASSSQKFSSRRSRRGSVATHGGAPAAEANAVVDEEAVGSTIARVLAIAPNAAPGVLAALAAQRQQVEDLRHALASEEAFVAARRSTNESAWLHEAQLRDIHDFERTRVHQAVPAHSPCLEQQQQRLPQTRPASAPSTPAAPSSAPAQRAPSSDVRSPLVPAVVVGFAPKLPEGSSRVVMRPACATRLQRYASAASRLLNRGSRSTTDTPYERQYMYSSAAKVQGNAGGVVETEVGSEYRFRSHAGICSAVERRGGSRRHEQNDFDSGDQDDRYGATADLSR